MIECIKCGLEDDRVLLFDVISKNGIVKICRKCNVEEDFPLIKQVVRKPLIENKKGVYERLSGYAGIDAEKHKKNFVFDEKEDLLKKQETNLKDLIDENFVKKIPEKKEEPKNLIHNFHWIIMRARRAKKMTQSQFALEILEPEEAIRVIEQGIVPEDSAKLILKIENYLRIKITAPTLERNFDFGEIDSSKAEVKKQFEKEVSFDDFTTKNLTISDLKEIGDKNVSRSESFKEEFLDPFQKDDRKKLSEETDLSDEEIEKIIYGK